MSADDLCALAQGDFSVDDFELGEENDHDPAGGDPASYSAAVTPERLASEGAELGYETLVDAVADPVDGELWSEELESDETRVGETTLRQNQDHKTASRVLAGLAR